MKISDVITPMLKSIKKVIFENKLLYSIYNKIKTSEKYKGNIDIVNNGCIRIKKEILGGGKNKLVVGKNTILDDVVIHMAGDNNRIIFEDNIYVGPGSSFWAEGNNVEIVVKSGTTFTRLVHINAQEDNSRIEIGKDCMFSNNILVRTSDSHAIYDVKSGDRVNPPKNVVIGNHVWIAPGSKVMKGAVIGNGSVIGSDTMVTNEIPDNSLAVGHPAKVVKSNLVWTREQAW